jgi:outer membrane protein assembly factor BamD (BamD/ComL family)
MTRTRENQGGVGHRPFVSCLLPLVFCLSSGCASFPDLTKPRVELPPPPQETVYRAGHWEQEAAPQPGTVAGDCASARVLFQKKEHSDAAKVFRWVGKRAEKEKNQDIFEECLFHEAECYYEQRQFPKARDLYARLLKEFPSSRYRNEAVRRQFEIAEFWLNDTREDMKQEAEQMAGKSSGFSIPRVIHFEKEKPTFDEEGNAVKACLDVYMQDPAGPLAAEALYRAGGVSFFRENYQDANDYYSVLVEQFPRSPLAPHALELAIQSKIRLTGGPDYDGRKLAEARQLVDTALRSYPELRDRREFLDRTLISVNERQAEKEFSTAEFYRRTNHPCSAYFYYEIVRRRYAGTAWADKATERMLELRDKVEKENAKTQQEFEKLAR